MGLTRPITDSLLTEVSPFQAPSLQWQEHDASLGIDSAPGVQGGRTRTQCSGC